MVARCAGSIPTRLEKLVFRECIGAKGRVRHSKYWLRHRAVLVFSNGEVSASRYLLFPMEGRLVFLRGISSFQIHLPSNVYWRKSTHYYWSERTSPSIYDVWGDYATSISREEVSFKIYFYFLFSSPAMLTYSFSFGSVCRPEVE